VDENARAFIVAWPEWFTSKSPFVAALMTARAVAATQTMALATTTPLTTRDRCARRSLRTASRTPDVKSGEALASFHVPNEPPLSTEGVGGAGAASATGAEGEVGGAAIVAKGLADFSTAIAKGLGLIEAMHPRDSKGRADETEGLREARVSACRR
jgi:hypothetical protein